MAHFPLFINLAGRRCIVVGAGPVASRKIKTLLDFGALVTVFDPNPSEEAKALCPPAALEAREYDDPATLCGAALVIAATDRRSLNQKLAADAGARGILVNVVDDPSLCTFFFPAIVRRGDAVAGISTAGGCPRLAARLRERIDNLWGPGMENALETLKAERLRLRAAGENNMSAALDQAIAGLGIDAAVTDRGKGNQKADTGRGPR